MAGLTLALYLASYGFTLWLGLYLLDRNPARPLLRYTGFGLVTYALGIAVHLLGQVSSAPEIAANLLHLHKLLILLPALLWSGVLLILLPESYSNRYRLVQGWVYGWLPLIFLLILFGATTELAATFSNGLIYNIFSFLIVAPLLGGLLMLIRHRPRPISKNAWGVLLVATLFFALEMVQFFFAWLPVSDTLLLLTMGGDLLLLGVAIAALDAFDEGNMLWPDMLRSLDASLLMVLLFAGQVVLVMFLSSGITFPMVFLLVTIMLAAIFIQTFSDPIQSLLDGIAFGPDRSLRQARAVHRVAASVLPRLPANINWDDEDFIRLTRRALSYYGDLSRLANSPLTQLPLIDERLNGDGDTLERAAELKALLAESIDRLKPRGEAEFGTTDEWRFYNALYFPYVMGLRPYSRHAHYDDLSPVEQEALEWFQMSVPERTLYNWQNTAAHLVAQILREKLAGNGSK